MIEKQAGRFKGEVRKEQRKYGKNNGAYQCVGQANPSIHRLKREHLHSAESGHAKVHVGS